MNCHHCSELLHDYAAAPHTLAAADRQALETHLAACPACRAGLDAARRLRAATAALPRANAPARDLWPGIAAQLAAPGQRTGAGVMTNAVPTDRKVRHVSDDGIA